MSVIKAFSPLKGKMLTILHPDGRCDEKLKPELSDDTVQALYRKMVFVRLADHRALNLQRQGRLGTYAPVHGQEAAQVGSAHALGEDDWVFPSFRETGVCTMRGMSLRNVYLYWMGNEMGHRVAENVHVFPISIPVGSHPLHAVGAAWAAKLKGEKMCTVAYFGDGGTSEGDFHEAMNFAGVFGTPTIFLCQNNQYAISVPRKIQTAAKTLAQKAIAYGFDGIQVDGNDLFAVYAATKEAREKALSGGGPTMIEAVTYRFGPHTTADDPTKYRKDQELEEWKPRDPLLRTQRYLQKKGLWSAKLEEEIKQEAEAEINRAVEEAENFVAPGAGEFFDFTFEELTPNLKEQREDFLAFVNERGQ
jgi:pyruvate dehydrogenase E1 component alpha subunit